MRVKMLATLAILAAVALPAQARASTFAGIVIAKQPQRGTLVLTSASGAGLTIHAASGARIGDRLALQGVRLRDGTIAGRQLRVLSHVREARIRGIVVRQRKATTLLATGHSVITIHSRAARRPSSSSDDGLRPGTPAEFRIRFDGQELVEEDAVALQLQAGNVEIEGVVVSVSPLVVSIERLPITITVPAGMTLPAALAPGQRIELIVQVGAGNVFTLVTIKEIENARPAVGREVRVKGAVVSSTAAQIVVSSGGSTFTFAAPAGVTLPILAVGTRVEVRGRTVNGVLTVERLKVENEGDDSGHDGHDGHDGHGGH